MTKLTDAQIKSLKTRMFNVGRETLIDRLENQMINKNMQGDKKAAARLEASIAFVRRHSGWVVTV